MPFWYINQWKPNSKFGYWGAEGEFLGHPSYGWRTNQTHSSICDSVMSGNRRLPAWAMQAKPVFLTAQQLSGSCATTSLQLSLKHRGLEFSKGCREIHTTIVCVGMPHLFFKNMFKDPLSILGDRSSGQAMVKHLQSCNLWEHLCYLVFFSGSVRTRLPEEKYLLLSQGWLLSLYLTVNFTF